MRCPTCGAVRPKDPEQRFWWDCWVCLFCPKYVCNEPGGNATCYVKHLREQHPEVYEVKK